MQLHQLGIALARPQESSVADTVEVLQVSVARRAMGSSEAKDPGIFLFFFSCPWKDILVKGTLLATFRGLLVLRAVSEPESWDQVTWTTTAPPSWSTEALAAAVALVAG